MSADPNYVTPGISVTQLSSQAVSPGPGAQGKLLILGTAPQGTSNPFEFTNLADGNIQYGSAAQAGSGTLFNLEPALEIAFSQAGVFNQLDVIGIRVGATAGVVPVPQISGGNTAYNLTARPAYAGKNNLVAVVGSPSYSGGTYNQSVALYDNTPAQAVNIEQYVGTNPQSITDQINAQSALMLCATAGGATGSSSNNFGVGGTYTLTGALDGSAAVDADYVNALALAEGVDADYVVALSPSAVVQQAVYNHVLKMVGQQKMREGILGVKNTGAPEANVVAQALQIGANYPSQYMCLVANQGGYRRDPVTGFSRIYDGYYWAVAIGAIKAINNPGDPLTRKAIAGLLGLTENFSVTSLNTLGANGVIAIRTTPTMVINDGVDLGPIGNYRKENIVAAECRLVKILKAQVEPLIGSADAFSNILAITAAITNALKTAQSLKIIRGFDPTQLTVNQVQPPSTAGQYNANIVYTPRVEVTRINFFLTLNLTLG